MSRNAYIVEAFKQFNSLMEEEDTEKISREELPIYDANTENMSSFLDMVGDDDDIDVDVIDLEAEAEEDLKQSYVGKVILDCNVCHSNIFVNKDEVIVDSEGNANVDLECPYCMSTDGYTIIGQVEPYSEETEEEIDIEEEEPGEFDEVEEIDLGESLKRQRRMRENIKRHNARRAKIRESIENVSIDTEDETMTMTTKEDGGIMIETSPRDSFEDGDFSDEEVTFDEMEDFGDGEFESSDEVIAPITDEDESEIELNSEVDALSDEDVDELSEPDDMGEFDDVDEIDVDEFDEDSFDALGESYLKKHYDNVEGFRTTNAKVFENSLIIEGVIRFTSGSSKGTSFIFEATNTKKRNVLFEGYNKQISRGKKTFKLNCSVQKGKIIPRSMSYNYTTKNELNESVRVNGTCKVK